MNNAWSQHDCIERFNAHLKHYLHALDVPAKRIKQAMEHSLFPGGKRMRPLLIYFCGALFDLPMNVLDDMALAMELMHTYSLIHDDLPAMDNDDYRRGLATCHREFDEATAILAGNSMQALALDVLVSRLPATLPTTRVMTIVHELIHASGCLGMLSGQSLDLLSIPENEQQLQHVHYLKTGKLILACINMVLAASHASTEQAEALRQFAVTFSLVFQMQDDYLDLHETQSHLGKKRASDLSNQKITFTHFYAKDALAHKIQHEFMQAQQHLQPFHPKAAALNSLLSSLLARSHITKNKHPAEND